MLKTQAWVPPAVAAVAKEMHASLNPGPTQLDGYRATIERLARDARMCRVWQELKKMHRSGPDRGSFYHPASVEAVQAHPASATVAEYEAVQDRACALLFIELARLRSWGERDDSIGPRAITKKQAADRIKKLMAAVERIRTEAGRLRDLGVGHLSPALEGAANQCLALAKLEETLNSQDRLIVDRKTSQDKWERGFILSAAHLLEYLFGQKMQGLVAVLANVAFNKADITEAQVNSMFRREGVY